MSEQLKIAQMNTKAVLQKLTEYEARIARQDEKIARLEAKLTQTLQQMNTLQSMMSMQQVSQLGSGPTERR